MSANMIQHVVLMNVAAPIAVLVALRYLPSGLSRSWHGATAVQLGVFWMWHSPVMMNAAMSSPLLHLLMQVSMFAVALWFWAAILTLPASRRWAGIFSLLVTAKLFCLLAALMIFAGRPLFATGMGIHDGAGITLADQELAGLIMIVACPLFYVSGGVYIAARWLFELDAENSRTAA
ncbi:cytochrome c oxidase assembly protein [Devosia pacifica]|uniref:cytochrome c oxidase assembly protein n=1 Tax=Devosia pacifica TaxID=1335967 RepID=UPI0016784405|nr:cytochrome c oxidase assembly protein [Devosia pacifica]